METNNYTIHQSTLDLKNSARITPLKPVSAIVHGAPLVVAILLVFLGVGWAAEPAPDFSLPDLSGTPVSLSQFRGNYVIVDFWATWCVPCRQSLPALAKAAKKYRSRNLVVLGLAVDDPKSFDNNYLENFVKKFDVDYPILRADNDVITRYLGDEEPSIPTLFFIDQQGRIVERHEGFISEELDHMIEKLMAGQ